MRKKNEEEQNDYEVDENESRKKYDKVVVG